MKQPGSIGRGIAVSTLGNLGAPLIALVSAPILAQSLGVDGRGEVAAITAPLLLAINAITFGIPESITYFTAGGKRNRARILGKGSLYLLVVGLLGSAALWWLAPLLTPDNPETSQAMVMASFALAPSLLLGGVRAFAAGQGLWGLISLERLFSSLSRLVGFLVLIQFNSLTVVAASLTIAGSGFVGIFVYLALWRLRGRPGPMVRSRRNSPLLSYGMRVWIGALTGILLSRLDQVLMIPLSNSYEMGLYAVAVSISEVTLVFNSAVRDVLFSTESASSSASRLTRAARVSTAVTLLGCLAVGISSTWLVPALFGDDFSAAIGIIEILLLGVLLGNPGSVAGAGLSARGRPGLRSSALCVAFTVNFLLVLLLVPRFGAYGAAWATLAGNVTAGFVCVVLMKVHFNFALRDFYGIKSNDLAGLLSVLKRGSQGRERPQPGRDSSDNVKRSELSSRMKESS